MTNIFDKVSTAKELKESDDFAGGLLLYTKGEINENLLCCTNN